jgi:thioesterase domain-containing protein/acyl carrier protein
MVPSAFVLLEALPQTPNGKVDRRALPAPEATRAVTREYVAPRDDLELQLTRIWEKVLSLDKVGVSDNFFELGGNSLLAVKLVAEIEARFKQNLPLASLWEAATVEGLAALLRSAAGSKHWTNLVPIQTEGARPPFFCMHPGGGNVLCYLELAGHVGGDQPFYGLQARGLDGRAEPHRRVEDMAACYIEALRTVQPDGPYYVGGHSAGGILAYEVARQLCESGQQVALTAIMDTSAPSDGPRDPSQLPDFDDDARWLTDIAAVGERFVGKPLGVAYDELRPLGPEEQLNYVWEKLQAAGVAPPGASTDVLRGLVAVQKAIVRAVFDYVPLPYSGRLTVFRCEPDGKDAPQGEQSPALGWDRLAADVEVEPVPGDHITMLTGANVPVLAERLREAIDARL